MMPILQEVTDHRTFSSANWTTVGLLDFTYEVMFTAGFKLL